MVGCSLEVAEGYRDSDSIRMGCPMWLNPAPPVMKTQAQTSLVRWLTTRLPDPNDFVLLCFGRSHMEGGLAPCIDLPIHAMEQGVSFWFLGPR